MTGTRGDLAAEIQRKSAEIESWPDWAQPYQPPSPEAPTLPNLESPNGPSQTPRPVARASGRDVRGLRGSS